MTNSKAFSKSLQRPLLLGVSGGETGVFLWEKPGELRHMAPAREGFSVYAVALSADGRRVVAGTKSPGGGAARGNVEVWTIPEQQEERPVAGGYALRFPAYSVDWVSEDVVAVGSMEVWNNGARGACLFFRVEARNKLERLDPVRPDAFRHTAPVVTVKALGDDRVLTVCAEGFVRVWNLQTGDQEAEVAMGTLGQPLGILPSAWVLPGGNGVMVQSPAGHIRLLDRTSGWAADEIPGMAGPCGGFALMGEELLISDWGSPIAMVLKRDDWQRIREVNFARPFRSLLPLSPTVVAVLHLDQTVSVWELGDSPICLENLQPAAIRGIGGGPSPAQLAKAATEARSDAEAARLGALKEAIQSAQDLHDIRLRIEDILREGHGFEGLVLLADWCRRQSKPVAELRVRRELCRDLPEVAESSPHLRIYGELLAAMGEPELAKAALQQARECDPSIDGLDSLIQELEAEPAPPQDERSLYLVEASDSFATSACEKAREGVLRDFAVGREKPRTYAVQLKSGVPLGRASAVGSLDLEGLCESLSSKVAGQVTQVGQTVVAAGDNDPYEAHMLTYEPAGQRGEEVSGGLFYVEFALMAGQLEYSLFASTPSPARITRTDDPEPFLAPWSNLGRAVDNDRSTLAQRLASFEEQLQLLAPKLLSGGGSGSTNRPPSSSDPPITDSEDQEWI